MRYRFCISLVVAAVVFLVGRVSADELTVGEKEFLKTIGRDCPVIRLWPEGKIPDEPQQLEPEAFRTTDQQSGRTGLMRIENVSKPSVTLVLPPKEKFTGTLIVLCPGGGYRSLGVKNVVETARWMNERGIGVALLKYRVPRRLNGYAKNHQPLQDAQRAISILRARAEEWGIHINRIGIGGFSAGGHVAASLAINYAQPHYQPVDDYDAVSCYPNFAVLVYPAYLTDPVASRERDPNLHYERISQESTPPTFIAITRPDKFAVGNVELSLALLEKKVSSELHVYPEGEHGASIETHPFGEWTNECVRFLGDHGMLSASRKRQASTFAGGNLPDVELQADHTLGDLRIQQLLNGKGNTISVWPNGTGPDETFQAKQEDVAARSRGGKALNIRDVTRPSLTVVQPPKAKHNRRAVIVCPGGAYTGLAIEHEGTRVCEWFAEQGFTAVLLKYRVPRREGEFPKHHHALQDLQRAIRVVRSNAEKWNLDPEKIGVCGFSAGGHLCATLCTNYEQDSYRPQDEVDRLSARPNFAALIYPAYLTEPTSSNEVVPLVKNLAKDKTPPLFMAAARDDQFTRGMLNFFLAVRAADIPAECHVFAGGGHGGGTDPSSYPASEWTRACARWLSDLK